MNAMRENIPHDESLERAVLGSILLENAQYDTAAALIGPEQFHISSNGIIFREIARMIREGIVADTLTVAGQLEHCEQLSTIGGRAYLCSLTENLPRKLAVADYAKRILELSQARQLMALV